MKAEALTPADIFGYHVRYIVPLFQRPYVWNQHDQWEPLWDDVRTVAERLLATRPGPPHFLGAIVVEQAPTLVGSVTAYHVIDGQQRLTTLQLLLDAARRVAESRGAVADARALRLLVTNETAKRREDETAKVWPTLGDRDAYLSVMGDDSSTVASAPVPAAVAVPARLVGDAVAQAHAYFVGAIDGWVGTVDGAAARLGALTRSISDELRAVVIHLDPGDNPQGIFETLNHRGAPLLAADLIKNLVFRLAQAQGLDVVALYQRYWADLDRPYWRAYVRRGRQVVPRIDVFVNYWLVMRQVDEVRTDQIFVSFREHLLEAGSTTVEDVLTELNRDARTYEAIAEPPADSVPGRFCYRVFDAMDAGAITPFYLWLMRWPEQALPAAQRDRALLAMESWVVRRWLCAMAGKDTNGLVLDLLRVLDAQGPARAGELTEAFLLGQRAASRAWPTDAAVRKALAGAAIDARPLRGRLRMLLEAIEDQRRTEKSEGSACERDLTVEHVMPLAWRQHWAAGPDPATGVLRDTLIHTLGNLTLVRYRLNAALANLPWTDAEATARGLGSVGKRTELSNHSLLKINAELVAANPKAWTEQAITARTAALAATAVQIWTRPPSAASIVDTLASISASGSTVDAGWGLVDDSGTGAGTTVTATATAAVIATATADAETADADAEAADADAETADADADGAAADAEESDADFDLDDDPERFAGGLGPRGKYARLIAFLQQQSADTLAMTFEQVEDVLGDPLPPTARTSIPYWSRRKAALAAAIAAAGYRPSNVDLWNERVIFARAPVRTLSPVRRRPPGRRRRSPPGA